MLAHHWVTLSIASPEHPLIHLVMKEANMRQNFSCMYKDMRSKDTRLSDVLEHANWHPLSYCYKLALLKLMHKAFYNRLPQVFSGTIAIKHAPGHSLRVHDSLTVPCFNTNYGKNTITHRGPILWNAIIAQDKDFADTNYKNLAKKICLMDIFKEFTFKETSVTTANFRCIDFNYI